MSTPLRSVKATRVRNVDSSPDDTFDTPTPEEINVPPSTIDEYMICIFGDKAAGKSTLAASFPDSLTLMFEPVRKGLSIRMIGTDQGLKKVAPKEIREGATDVWAKVVRSTPVWINDPTIKRLNYDSIDILYECCYASVCARNNVNAPGDSKNGPDIWNEIRDEFSAYFSALRETDMGITFLSHVKTREMTNLDHSKIKGIYQPSCSPMCLQFIRQAADFIVYLGSQDGRRAALVRDPTQQSVVATSPENVFMQPDGKPITVLEMPDKSAEPHAGYRQLVRAFNNECWDMETPLDERGPKPPPTPKRPIRK
jgi:GTPase SAR1 family protein